MSTVSGGGGSGAIVRQGHLRKLKTMKKKYFVLRAETPESSARLEYYESEKKFRAGASPRRILPLKSCYNITRRLDLKQKHVIALFTREEQFCIVAENEQDLHLWLAAILKQHGSEDASKELLHPIQHVWQVNVQKKGLGALKNIQGLYNLCLTDKTLALVKIKSHNNVISDLGIPEKVEYSLKNIRRCGDSECFFYMEVGRQTTTGAGELWMLSDDSNIAQSMHSTIYHAMQNCAKETENERDHIVVPKTSTNPLPARRQTYSDGRGRAGLANDASTLRHRCDSLPTRTSAYETERAPARHSDFIDGLDMSRDEPDAIGDWHRTPRIPEEPDICDALARDFITQLIRPSVNHSRTTSWCENAAPPGYLPMAPAHSVTSASSGSVCSHTPSADPRTREYQLEPATAHISEERSGRAYSVGSRPPPRDSQADGRHRAYSVGAGSRPSRPLPHALPAPLASSPPRAPPASDLMELDFSPRRLPPSSVGRSPPAERHNTDEYVDMSPRTHSSIAAAASLSSAAASAAASGYVEMSYTRAASKPVGDCVDCAGSLPFPLTVEEVLQASIPPPARPASPPAPPLASPPAPPPASPPRPAAPAESLSTVRERETEDADMKTHSEGGSPPPTPTPSGLHYAALALEPRRACRPPVHTPHYTTLQFRHD